MNKLVLIGNGFDKAHGLSTSYSDFINDFWKNIKNNFEKEDYKSLVFIKNEYSGFLESSPISSYDDIVKNLKTSVDGNERLYDNENHECYTNNTRFHPIFKFENEFFKILCISNTIQNWVDIENEYYKSLKRIVKLNKVSKIQFSEDSWTVRKKKQLEKLNKEFDQVKTLLRDYLKRNINEKYNFSRVPKHFDHLLCNLRVEHLDLENSRAYNDYLQEFSEEDHEELIEFDNKLIEAKQGEGINSFLNNNTRTIFLNFNYTNSIAPYVRVMNGTGFGNYMPVNEISIHGKLNGGDDQMNFGFGDEMDEDYKLIENIDDNKYLRNFKSFKYSQNSNYKDFLNFIHASNFQVLIMGHSCGLSDRTLLNTIFEHPNCRSIKVFFHERETTDGKTDNFTDIIQNISRHFDDKKLMRSKVVNKSLCKPLPQDIRFALKIST